MPSKLPKTPRLKLGRIVILLLLAILLVIAGCAQKSAETSDTGKSNTAPSGGKTVTIQNFAFGPDTITISKGDTVSWINQDSAPHKVTSDSGNELDSPSIANGQSFSHTFSQAGEYDYHCGLHPGMKAKIIVQ